MGEDGRDDVNTPIVVVKNLDFSYRIRNASAQSLKQNFIDTLKRKKSDVYVTAISGVNFELSSGEVLGIVGNNGAGKSTLLKLLAGILPPSSGIVKVKGRIAPLIELGAGFNPELTGAENIVLFGVLLGNPKVLMDENKATIAEWAGLSESIHLPIRTYSTGMISRLGFAIATFQASELLIVDEVLSVGDIDFQAKSINRLDELISTGEATILVSHDLDLVQAKASKVLWLDLGKQVMLGNPEEVIDAYRNT
jgi:ABC-type polysaccharide/polyol phosphate transport system ATPase subunit